MIPEELGTIVAAEQFGDLTFSTVSYHPQAMINDPTLVYRLAYHGQKRASISTCFPEAIQPYMKLWMHSLVENNRPTNNLPATAKRFGYLPRCNSYETVLRQAHGQGCLTKVYDSLIIHLPTERIDADLLELENMHIREIYIALLYNKPIPAPPPFP